MSDLISRGILIKRFKQLKGLDTLANMFISDVIKEIKNQPTVEAASKWIPCSERLPEERESIFKKAKGTDKWRVGMFEGISDDVNVTIEFEDGTRKSITSHTLDGKWECEKEYRFGNPKVVAWMPLPKPYKAGSAK